MSDIVRAALAAVVEGRTLSLDEAHAAMGAVMDGEATASQLAAFLVALRMRGETIDELAGFAVAMRERVLHVTAPDGAIDVVGTGGDSSGTFNISTTSALVVAAAGVPVAKHGNRAITSRSGSSDVLDALVIRIDHDADSAGAALAALWHDGRGDWAAAHRVAQDIDTPEGAWIHAYLHRKDALPRRSPSISTATI